MSDPDVNETSAETPKEKRSAARVAKFKETMAKKKAAAEAAKLVAETIPIIPPVERPDPRPDMRPQMREEDPRTRAARRAAEIENHLGNQDEGTDDFFIPADMIPEGWTYEWKRKTVLNQEDPAYQVQIARTGWEPVPASRHPAFMPVGGKHVTIERKGMILMERPSTITDRARQIELQRARNQIRQKEAQLSSAPDGQFDRSNKGDSLVKVRRSVEPMVIPKD